MRRERAALSTAGGLTWRFARTAEAGQEAGREVGQDPPSGRQGRRQEAAQGGSFMLTRFAVAAFAHDFARACRACEVPSSARIAVAVRCVPGPRAADDRHRDRGLRSGGLLCLLFVGAGHAPQWVLSLLKLSSRSHFRTANRSSLFQKMLQRRPSKARKRGFWQKKLTPPWNRKPRCLFVAWGIGGLQSASLPTCRPIRSSRRPAEAADHTVLSRNERSAWCRAGVSRLVR